MAKVSISEAARLTGKSRTTLHKLIKKGDLSTCHGERNTRMVDTSELLRVFGAFVQSSSEQRDAQLSAQPGTAVNTDSEQVISQLQLEIAHLKELVSAKDSHIDSLKQAMLMIEHTHSENTPWWQFWKRR
ncbi:TPA: helix-turn-helix domain-containing protein [Enterobacter hormaechei]